MLQSAASQEITLSTDGISLTFNTSPTSGFGELLAIRAAGSQRNLLSKPLASVWSAEMLAASSSGVVVIGGTSHASSYEVDVDHSARIAELRWVGLEVGTVRAALNVSLLARLSSSSASFRLRFSSSTTQIALWQWRASIGNLEGGVGSGVFENAGFGVVHRPPVSFDGIYPQQTMQFVAQLPATNASPGVYWGAHDPHGSSKGFSCAASDSGTIALSIYATPPGAGQPLTSYMIDYDLTLALYSGDWWDASQVYRKFVLASADWTRSGPLSGRTGLPDWLPKLTTWVNSHWQGNDIFNTSGLPPRVRARARRDSWCARRCCDPRALAGRPCRHSRSGTAVGSGHCAHCSQRSGYPCSTLLLSGAGGDPMVVEQRVSAIAERFALPPGALGLHWYEWDTLGYAEGSNYTKCETEITCECCPAPVTRTPLCALRVPRLRRSRSR
jgi:hypothetical protein